MARLLRNARLWTGAWVVSGIAWTLRPLFRSAGMRWQSPPVNWPLVVLGTISAMLFVAAIVLTILGQ